MDFLQTQAQPSKSNCEQQFLFSEMNEKGISKKLPQKPKLIEQEKKTVVLIPLIELYHERRV